jgi:hypothetical protein
MKRWTEPRDWRINLTTGLAVGMLGAAGLLVVAAAEEGQRAIPAGVNVQSAQQHK